MKSARSKRAVQAVAWTTRSSLLSSKIWTTTPQSLSCSNVLLPWKRHRWLSRRFRTPACSIWLDDAGFRTDKLTGVGAGSPLLLFGKHQAEIPGIKGFPCNLSLITIYTYRYTYA